MAVQGYVKLFQHADRHGAGRDAGRSLASAGPFQDVPHVFKAIFHRPRQVGMSGPDAGDSSGARVVGVEVRLIQLFNGHRLLPVDPVFVFQGHSNRAAEGFAVPDPRMDYRMVLLYEHTTAPAIAFLAASKLAAYEPLI